MLFYRITMALVSCAKFGSGDLISNPRVREGWSGLSEIVIFITQVLIDCLQKTK
jgi:hypothetical protein